MLPAAPQPVATEPFSLRQSQHDFSRPTGDILGNPLKTYTPTQVAPASFANSVRLDGLVKDGKIKAWEDIDQKGIKTAVTLGSYIEGFMKGYLKNAEVVSIAPPNTREAELVARRVDVVMTDFPTAIKVADEFDWATYLLPKEKLAVTPYAYVVPPGDQIWLNYINLFVDTIKLDGRLMHYAKKHKLDPIVAP